MKKVILLSFFIFCCKTLFAFETIDNTIKYGVLIDFDTGEILYEKNKNEITAPSSTTKIMTAYVIFDMLEEGKISLNDKFRVSVKAWRQEGTRMFLEPDWKITVDELLKGLIIVSGNDSAIVLAEGSAKTINNFVGIMNETAKKLGMKDTNFTNPNGLYEKNHYMSVYDLAILSQALIKNHYKYYKKYFSQSEYSFNNIKQKNKNVLLSEYDGVDGLKTGFTDYGKYSMSASVNKQNKRLIAVVNGANSEKERSNQVKSLFDYGYKQYSYIELYRSGDVIGDVNVLFGSDTFVSAYTKNDIIYSTNKNRIENIKVEFIANKYLQAPIKKDDVVGYLQITDKDRITKVDLLALNDIEVATRLQKIKSLFIYNSKKLIEKD